METSESNFRVLSIQSHVVYGYVGNKSACFPLQVLGFEVDMINSVQLSNHTGYESIKGQILKADELTELYDGLKTNNLLHCSHLLTGYVGSVSFLTKLSDIIKEMKKNNPDLYVVIDPVMGDNGQMYVPDEVLPVYKNDFMNLANLMTPNQFEAELLTGITIKSKESVFQVLKAFHEKGVETVVLSSVQLETSKNLFLFGSSIKKNKETSVYMEIPKLSGVYTGTGDVFTALLLAWMARTDGDLKLSCQRTINSLHSILIRTSNYASKESNLPTSARVELKLIQSKHDIENPPSHLECHQLESN
ncbi:pyridoxal kinase [Parasteatoda tepidariorum]|uniref:pyridoxal kinase n=1 Tax=Parasteatoda tepidariorum TaxID=114398 RepID=UPI00077FB5CB|nr:pyridoxal kinase [Parasteatoda tepidariorum]